MILDENKAQRFSSIDHSAKAIHQKLKVILKLKKNFNVNQFSREVAKHSISANEINFFKSYLKCL